MSKLSGKGKYIVRVRFSNIFMAVHKSLSTLRANKHIKNTI